jgi:DnaJ-class molecular chaperone
MALKNYYIILGISPTTSAEGVRGAFRQLAKKFHPDKAGGERTAFFQDITEAYEVLSDPEKRKLYNQKLTDEKKRQKTIPIRPEPHQYGKREDHFRPNVLEMDVFLTVQEAFSGVTLNLRVSIPFQCLWCGGTGRDFFFNCIRCHGSGNINMKRSLEIKLPPRLKHGDRIKSMIALSEENYLHLLIQVYII